jgi:Flp pilus assembly pilin Flp
VLHDERGVASVEYLIVLTLVACGASVAIVELGRLLLELFLFQRSILLRPYP